jgi:regulator of sigma E protease
VTIILFIIIFGIIVLSHEFGHFIVAKKNGIHVVEFAIGMGPTLLHLDRDGTRYSVKLLPFGGACMFEGEDALSAEKEEPAPYQEEKGGSYRGGSFPEASVWTRIATIFAGPFVNLLLGFLIALILVAYRGTDLPVIQMISEGSAAEEAGLMAGDVITRMNGEKIHVYREVRLNSMLNSDGKDFSISYLRDGTEYSVVLSPRYSEADDRYYIGLMGVGEYMPCRGFSIIRYGFYESEYVIRNTIKSLQMLVTGKLGKDDVSGPVGVASYVGETYETVKEYGFVTVLMTMLELVVILSINLGVMNLLPLPALDGGRLVFLLLEVIRGKPVPPEKEGFVHMAGLILFFLLMIFVMYNDIMRLIR